MVRGMRVKPEHYTRLVEGLRDAVNLLPSRSYFREVCKRDPRVLDWEACYRWELFYAAFTGAVSLERRDLCNLLYEYCADTHIDTALRKAVGEILG
jgi:hypothetical protein